MARGDLRAKIRLEGDASGANAAIKSTQTGFTKLRKSLRSGAIAIASALATVTGAFKLLESAGKRLAQERALERSLEAQGASVDDFVGKLKDLSNNQIATSDIILAANRALALGISKDDIPGLLEAATRASVSLGISATQAFNDITTGVGRASPLILDNLGIIVDSVKIYEDMAAAIGTSVDQLTKQQKTAALAAAVMKNAATGAEDFAKAQSDLTVEITRSTTKIKNWLERVAEAAAENQHLVDALRFVNEDLVDTGSGWLIYSGRINAAAEAERQFNAVQGESTTGGRALLDFLKKAVAGFAGLTVNRRIHLEVLEQEVKNEALANRIRLGVLGLITRVTAAQVALNRANKEGAIRTARIEQGLLDEATALDVLRAAIGEVTQAELQKQFDEITVALAKARIETGGSTAAFIDMEEKITPVLKLLRTNIERVSQGLGVLEVAADETGDEFDELSVSIDKTNTALSDQASQATVTATALRQLTGVAESLSLAEARTALAITQAARRGVSGVSSQQTGIGAYTGLPVGPGTSKTYIVNPDGSLRPA